jgi:hypothetical protein
MLIILVHHADSQKWVSFFICHENSVFLKNEVTLLNYHPQFVGQKPLCSRVDWTRMFNSLHDQH